MTDRHHTAHPKDHPSGMTLRSTLLGLIGFFGLSLFATAACLTVVAAQTYRSSHAALTRAQDHDALFSLLHALSAEDIATAEAAANGPAPDPAEPARRSDAALAAALDRLATAEPTTANQLQRFAADLARHRITVTASGTMRNGRVPLDEWHRRLIPQYRAIERLSLLPAPETATQDPQTNALLALRSLVLRGTLGLARSRILIETRLQAPPHGLAAFAASQQRETASQTGMIRAAAFDIQLLPDAVAHATLLALSQIEHPYQTAETRLLAAARTDPVDTATLTRWRDLSRLALGDLDRADTLLASAARDRLDAALIASRTQLAALSLLSCAIACLVAGALRQVQRRILSPLGHVAARIAALAHDSATGPSAPAAALPEIATMQAGLDLLCKNGARRDRMQAELARLSDRVVTANRQMTADLEAAARVQKAQLPAAPRSFPGGFFHALFRPSRVVAGDTYDCLTLADGRSRIFQIDVSGHGAPAALVSIASHIALKQALLSAPPSEAMADTIARINSDWAEDLPYFTLLAVEIDPAAHTAQIVQCGHPALIRLPATGGAQALGDGGLPIGVLPQAAFFTLACPFLPGDRLILATDGVTETADPEARMFGDDRFRDLLTFRPHEPVQRLFDRIERALWDWRGTETLDDDITILVLEAA